MAGMHNMIFDRVFLLTLGVLRGLIAVGWLGRVIFNGSRSSGSRGYVRL